MENQAIKVIMKRLEETYSPYLPTAKRLLPFFLASIMVGVILAFSVSLDTAHDIRFWLTPTPWLRAVGLPAGSPYFQRVLELEAAHQAELLLVFAGFCLWDMPGLAVLLGEGFEWGFYRATDIRMGLLDGAGEFLRIPQYFIGYGVILLAVSMAHKERCSPNRYEIANRWQRLKKNPWPLLLLILGMFINDVLEAFWFI